MSVDEAYAQSKLKVCGNTTCTVAEEREYKAMTPQEQAEFRKSRAPSLPDSKTLKQPSRGDTGSISTEPPASSGGYYQGGGGCLIATAALGTEMVSDVQHLRDIRSKLYDSEASSFMHAINSFYYSFSPNVADLQRQNHFINDLVKLYVSPGLAVFSTVDTSNNENFSSSVSFAIFANILLYAGIPVAIVFNSKRIIRSLK